MADDPRPARVRTDADRGPRGTTAFIYTPFFHRDADTLPYANTFAPDIWLDAQSDRPLDVLAAVGMWDRATDRDVARDEIADKLLGEWRQRHPQVPVRLDVVDDRPARALMERSDHARLLVVGNRGRGAVSRVLLGSVSHAAMYHASCPVIVVPAADDAS